MSYKYEHDGVEIEVDDDVKPDDLDLEAEPGNALTEAQLQEILDDETTLGE